MAGESLVTQRWLSKNLHMRGAQIFNYLDLQKVLRND